MKGLERINDKAVAKRVKETTCYDIESLSSDLVDFFYSAMEGTLLYSVSKSDIERGCSVVKVCRMEKSPFSGKYSLKAFRSMLKCLGFRLSEECFSGVIVEDSGLNATMNVHMSICKSMEDLEMIGIYEYHTLSDLKPNII